MWVEAGLYTFVYMFLSAMTIEILIGFSVSSAGMKLIMKVFLLDNLKLLADVLLDAQILLKKLDWMGALLL